MEEKKIINQLYEAAKKKQTEQFKNYIKNKNKKKNKMEKKKKKKK